jgi:hypothetical protein
LFTLCMTGQSRKNIIPHTNVFYSEGKTDLKLRCNCVWHSRYSRVPKTFLVDWPQCVACYFPTTPYRLPQHYKRQVCGPSCSCKHWYLWVSPILSITFVWFVWVQYATDNLSGQERVFVS